MWAWSRHCRGSLLPTTHGLYTTGLNLGLHPANERRFLLAGHNPKNQLCIGQQWIFWSYSVVGSMLLKTQQKRGWCSCKTGACWLGWGLLLLFMMTSSDENISALLALCVGNSPVSGEFRTQRPVTRSFDVFFDLRVNKRLSKQSWGWWFKTPSYPLWR